MKIPTFQLSVPLLSNPADILTYAIRHYLSIAPNIYESFLLDELSFRKRVVEYEQVPDELKSFVEIDLSSYLQRNFFKDNIIDVTVEIKYIDDRRYSVVIDVTVQMNDKIYSISPNIDVDGNTFKINFNDV